MNVAIEPQGIKEKRYVETGEAEPEVENIL